MSTSLAGWPSVQDIVHRAGHGAQVPQVVPCLADHGVQIIADLVPVVGGGGACDAHDGSPRVVDRRRRKGRLSH